MKERLVGAAVLMAAAVILIPEMLSGPDRASAQKKAETEAGPIKTYTIDLDQPPGASPPAVVAEETDRAPPPEESPDTAIAGDASSPSEASALAQPQTAPEIVAQTSTPAAEERTPAPVTRAEPSRPSTPQTTRSEAPSPKAAPQPARTETSPPRTETPSRQAASSPARTETPTPPKTELAPARAIASPPTAPTSSASAVKSGWAVQLGSYSTEATAERLRNEWRAKGLDAFVMPVKSGSKTLYRVRIGPTKDRAAADAALKAVKPSNPGAAVVAHP